MLLSDAQSTGLRDLSLCHWVVNVGELSSGAPSQLEPLSRLGCDDATTVALKPESMPRGKKQASEAGSRSTSARIAVAVSRQSQNKTTALDRAGCGQH